MKSGWLIVAFSAALCLTACGGEKSSAHNQADAAKPTLQEKADALARQASMSPPPPTEKKK